MAIGRFVTDLDQGDVLGPVDYVMSRFVVREYCHSVEMHQPCFQGVEGQIAPPTLVHLDKLRLYKHACPAGTGPTARVHYRIRRDDPRAGADRRAAARQGHGDRALREARAASTCSSTSTCARPATTAC